MIGEGKRFNEGKVRHDLVPAHAIHEVARVLTFGSLKYAPHNWMKGMAWSNVIASLKRHLNAIERGEDFDPESGLLHASHVMCNAMFLVEYYRIFPQGDDRVNHTVIQKPRIGLDIDDVLADFVEHYCKRFNVARPNSWSFDRELRDRIESVKDDKEFWLSIPALIKAAELPIDPVCYITARNIDTKITEEWLKKHNFPAVPVYTAPVGTSKAKFAKDLRLDVFVDDSPTNFTDLTANGICTFLMDRPWNRNINAGFKRVYSLQQVADWFDYTKPLHANEPVKAKQPDIYRVSDNV